MPIYDGSLRGIFDFHVFCSFLAAISSFLYQSGQTKYLWNLWGEFYLVWKLHYDFIEKSIFSKKSKKKNFDVESFFFDWSGCLMAQKTVKWQGLNLFKCTFRFLKYPNIWIFGFRKKSKNLLPYIWALSFYGCFEPSTSLICRQKNWFKKIAKIINPPPRFDLFFEKSIFLWWHNAMSKISS